MNEVTKPDHRPKSESGFHQSYTAYSRTLRAWLVAYGIGAPVLFTSQDAFVKILQQKNAAIAIVIVFLIGVSLQVVAAFVYKVCMWYMYWGCFVSTDLAQKRGPAKRQPPHW